MASHNWSHDGQWDLHLEEKGSASKGRGSASRGFASGGKGSVSGEGGTASRGLYLGDGVGQTLRRYIKKRAICILLEFFLVSIKILITYR